MLTFVILNYEMITNSKKKCILFSGNVKNGFIAQFIPNAVGLHVVLVEYNGIAVGGTPFYSKAGPRHTP